MKLTLKQLIKRVEEFDKVSGRVGWFESARYDDGKPVAQVAMWQEYGTSRIPPRPFLNPTAEEKREEWAETISKGAQAVIKGNFTAEQVMTVTAQQAAADIRVAISEVREPELSPVTLLLRKWRKEGREINGTAFYEAVQAVKNGARAEGVSTQPLNDTGYMIATLTGIAVKK